MVWGGERCWRALVVAGVVMLACGEPVIVEERDGGDAAMDSGASGDAGEVCSGDPGCDDGLFCNGAERCDPGASGADSRGCVGGTSPCGEGEVCDETAGECRPECADADGDGHGALECGGDDCDDLDANRFPGNVEVCDGSAHDEDCNPDTFGFIDADGDGAASNACCNVLSDGSLRCGGDCNDADGAVNPRAGDGPPLFCDGIDNDCDGAADEACPCVEGAERECGTDAQRMRIGICRPGTQVCVGGAWTEVCNGAVAPAEEVCDALDNDCDAVTDEGVLRTYYADADGDGYGLAGSTSQACSPPAGWTPDSRDCDDTVPSVNPAAPELCNGVDDDCDASTDEGVTGLYYRDADGDGFGDAAMPREACTRPSGHVTDSTDCDDAVRTVNPPAAEVCDGIDNNCDGAVDVGCSCTDGATRACGTSDVGECARGTQRCLGGTWGECVGAVEPRSETCNGLDDDCDGTVDDGVLRTFYLDADGDGFGTSASTADACELPADHSAIATDCDDSRAAVNPAATERCNGIDDNCAGGVDEGCSCTDGATRPCGTPDGAGGVLETGECTAGAQVCVAGAWGGCIGAVGPRAESCNGLDDDCDGSADEGTTASCYADGDGDGYGTGGLRLVCAASGGGCPSGYSAMGGDCNDGAASMRPGATESCNGADDDCDGSVDEGTTASCYGDADGDGYGVGSALTLCAVSGACPSGYAPLGGDCNDASAAVRPGAAESCNALDDDCDGAADDGFTCVRGAERTCTTGCSTPGTQSCLLDCSGWSTCRADLEACNACDDDADGTVDESFTCVRASTGNACSTSCGTLGTYTCSSSCTAGVCRGTEACNGCDDDLDGTADEGFTCALGASRSCTTACGTSGTQSCQSDCSEWRSCRASSETCNGCDDDLNGAADDGFACVRGLVYGCTTACGTPGQRTCTGTCTLPSSCFATGEYCNYCDDNGIADLADEASLATSSSTRWLYRCSDVSRTGSATNVGCVESGGATRIRVVTSTSQTGAAYFSLRLGYGPVEAWARAAASLNGSSYPAEGWALSVYEGTGTILGAGGTNLGVNHARRGFSAEWRFYNGTFTTQADMLALRVLDGDGTANSPLRSAVAPTPHLDGTTSGVVTQEVRLVVHPDIPGTAMREDYVELYDEAGALLHRQAPVSPALAPGQTVQIAVTASTGSTYFSRVDLVGGFELFFSGGLRARTNATCP